MSPPETLRMIRGPLDSSTQVLQIAYETGFDLAGLAPLRRPLAGDRFEAWLAAGRHAGMDWIERQKPEILDPRQSLPGGKTLLVVGLAHARAAVTIEGGGRVARYAAGRDYHNVVRRMLSKLARALRLAGLTGRSRRIVDNGPLLERSHAAEAGLGFESKAANLLHPRLGPWFFLAELVLDREHEPTGGPAPGSCGTCTACLDACPTGAILEPGSVDARLCISYQTIENRGPVPPELRPQIGSWVFGCDVCSEVCPWGRDAGDFSGRFGTHEAVKELGLVDWVASGEGLSQRLAGSPLQRPTRAGLARNAAIVLGNSPSDAGRVALLEALSSDPAGIVREAAAWSLARAHGGDEETRKALETAARMEPEPWARTAVEQWLQART